MIGTKYTYDEMNRRTSTTSPEGKILQVIAYDAKGQAQKIVDGIRYNGDIETSPGTVYEYDGLGRLIQETDALDEATKYEYDVLDQLVEKTDARQHTTAYQYQPNGTLESIRFADGSNVSYAHDLIGRKTIETDQRGNATTFSYNAFGKKSRVTDPYGAQMKYQYDRAGNLAAQTDKRGSTRLFQYDARHQLIEKRIPLDIDGSGNVVYRIEAYQYDEVGNLKKETVTGSKDSSFKRETNYTYTVNNQLHTASDLSGAYTVHHYDLNGNVTKQESLRDTGVFDISRFEYDTSNRLVKRIQLVDEEDVLEASDFSNIEALRDTEYEGMLQLITGYAYDRLGNKTKEIQPRAYQKTDPIYPYSVTFSYDALNRLDKRIRKHEGEDVFTQYTYDEVGNNIAERNERGHITRYTYDAMNRVETVTDAKQHTFTHSYDAAGNKESETNAEGHTMTYSYDKLNRLVTVTDPYQEIIEKNVYDANGNLIKKMDAKGFLSASTDEQRYGTTYSYDLANRLKTVVDEELAEKGGLFTKQYTYNPVGETTEETDALGNSYKYTYDQAGRLIQVTDPLGIRTNHMYDKAGNKVYMIDGRGKVTSYNYGAFGLLKEVTDASNQTCTTATATKFVKRSSTFSRILHRCDRSPVAARMAKPSAINRSNIESGGISSLESDMWLSNSKCCNREGGNIQNQPSQSELNELFHFLKKYDLITSDEQEARNIGMRKLISGDKV